jgi:hypothetical protein
MEKSTCENCPIKNYAERKPNSIIARIWRWHTNWCPGWKAYQQALAEKERETSNATLGGN